MAGDLRRGALALSLAGRSVAWLTLIAGLLIVIAVLFARPLFESLAAGYALSSRHGFNVGIRSTSTILLCVWPRH